MTGFINFLLFFSSLILVCCHNHTDTESHEVLEFPELEIGRVKRSTRLYLEKGEYCAVYRPNFDYYCTGIWQSEKLIKTSRHLDRIKKFCPTYKYHCIAYKKNRPHHRRKYIHRDRDSIEDELRGKSYEEILRELSEIVPCTPECNPNAHPHCTQECKCDYDYPTMQRFCNPPTLAMFLNICRHLQLAAVEDIRIRDRVVISIRDTTIYCGDAHEKEIGDCAIALRNDYNNFVDVSGFRAVNNLCSGKVIYCGRNVVIRASTDDRCF